MSAKRRNRSARVKAKQTDTVVLQSQGKRVLLAQRRRVYYARLVNEISLFFDTFLQIKHRNESVRTSTHSFPLPHIVVLIPLYQINAGHFLLMYRRQSNLLQRFQVLERRLPCLIWLLLFLLFDELVGSVGGIHGSQMLRY